MEQVLIHEYFRILVPALLFTGVLKVLLPEHFPDEPGQLLFLAGLLGLITAPFFDRLAKKVFHNQTIKVRFYEKLAKAFLTRYHLVPKPNPAVGDQLESFSGTLHVPSTVEYRCVIEAYKIFSRHGWSSEEDKYRIRTEKSFGILYFSLLAYFAILLPVSLARPLLSPTPTASLLVPWPGDTVLILGLMAVCYWECVARFRMSLNNELLVLTSHLTDLKTLYDDLLVLHQEECDP